MTAADGTDRERSEQELMSVVSYLYYYADINQGDIADRLFLSRSTVSRLLKKARQSGVVELKINEPWQRDLATEDEIKTTFSIDSVRVLKFDAPDFTAMLDALGEMTSFHISCNLSGSSTLGLSWGNTISRVVSSITTSKNIPFTVVPIMGSMTWPNPNPKSIELSCQFSRIYGGRYFPLDAPLYAASREQRESLLRSPENAEALETARNADMILTSVGSIQSSSHARVVGPEKLAKLCEIGCVGHIGGHFFDISGREIEGSLKELHMGLTLEEIRASGNVICVAASEEKAEAIYGALRGELLNTLMLTYGLARKLLTISEARRL